MGLFDKFKKKESNVSDNAYKANPHSMLKIKETYKVKEWKQ